MRPFNTPRAAFQQSLKDAFPAVVGLMPFGLITGATATAAGMDPWLAFAMSVIVFAGASQLAAIQLMTQHAPFLVILATVLVINLRFVMYSAALAPYFRRFSPWQKWFFAYALTDHLFALITTRFNAEEHNPHLDAYYASAALFMWVVWQVMVAIGIVAGTLVPKAWSLDFAIPLVFLALVLPALTSRTHWLTAITASIAALFTASLPLKLGLLAAAATGVVVGTLIDWHRERATS